MDTFKRKISVEKLSKGHIRSCNVCHAPNHDTKETLLPPQADAVFHVTIDNVFELAICDKCYLNYLNILQKGKEDYIDEKH